MSYNDLDELTSQSSQLTLISLETGGKRSTSRGTFWSLTSTVTPKLSDVQAGLGYAIALKYFEQLDNFETFFRRIIFLHYIALWQ